MGKINSYILILVGVSFIVSVFSLVVPNGRMSNFVKSILGMFIFLSFVIPLVSFINNESNFELNYQTGVVEVNNDFIENIVIKEFEKNAKLFEKDIINTLGNDILFNYDKICNNSQISLRKIYLDLSGLVMNNNYEHIDVLDTVYICANKYFIIDKENIIVLNVPDSFSMR